VAPRGQVGRNNLQNFKWQWNCSVLAVKWGGNRIKARNAIRNRMGKATANGNGKRKPAWGGGASSARPNAGEARGERAGNVTEEHNENKVTYSQDNEGTASASFVAVMAYKTYITERDHREYPPVRYILSPAPRGERDRSMRRDMQPSNIILLMSPATFTERHGQSVCRFSSLPPVVHEPVLFCFRCFARYLFSHLWCFQMRLFVLSSVAIGEKNFTFIIFRYATGL